MYVTHLFRVINNRFIIIFFLYRQQCYRFQRNSLRSRVKSIRIVCMHTSIYLLMSQYNVLLCASLRIRALLKNETKKRLREFSSCRFIACRSGFLSSLLKSPIFKSFNRAFHKTDIITLPVGGSVFVFFLSSSSLSSRFILLTSLCSYERNNASPLYPRL